ncbi:MAG: hypothetical protein BroJett011_06730 [Chloroflexota bacterium]|nr:MAG: hypothetical protein BroJett011_06730 [Chloroflexota bacterium]
MTFTLSQIEIAGTLSTGPVIHLDNIAKRICHEALEQTYDKLVPVEQELSLECLLQRRALFQSFKYGLAKGVAETLAANDKRVRRVYVIEPSANPDAEVEEHLPVEVTIHLVVVVETTSAALEALIASLDRGLVQCLQELPSPLLAGCHSILDVNLVTEEAVRHRTGYANLLSSIFAPPLKLWERQA